MKKSLLLATALLAFATNILSAPVGRERALKSAQEFLNGKRLGAGRRLAPAQTHLQSATPQTEAYYAFNIGQGEGFILVSGDDGTRPIIGYAQKGTFDTSQMPDNMKAWLKGYERQIAWIQRQEVRGERQEVRGEEREPVMPLVNCHWDQHEPFNYLCPLVYGDERSVTGCIPTAMAQVIYYHRRPKATTATIPEYTTATLKAHIEEKGITPIDWDNLLPSYGNNQSAEADTAVATLMSLCGQAIKVDYHTSTAGNSVVIAQALRKYFGFAPSTKYILRDNYRLQEWEDIIYGELAGNRPVLYGGDSSGGGHEFVVDGYDKDGLFHINWGWGGMSDGYFLLTVLNSNNNQGAGASSSADGYSFNQDAVVGITPDNELPTPTSVLTIEKIDIRGGATTMTRQSDGGFHPFVRGSVFNFTGEEATFSLGLLIIDAEGNICESYPVREISLNTNMGINLLNFGDQSLKFRNLPDGTYTIAIGSCLKGAEEGLRPCEGTTNYAIEAQLTGNQLTLQLPEVNLNGTITPEGTVEEGSPFFINIEVTNNGTNFVRDVFVLVDGKMSVGFRMEAEPGATVSHRLEMQPLTQGTRKVELAYIDGTSSSYQPEYITIATTEIDVAPAPQGEPKLVFDFSIENLRDNYFVTSGRDIAYVQITNEGSAAFNGDAGFMLLLLDGNMYGTYSYQFSRVSLPKGQTTTIPVALNNLPNNSEFRLYGMIVANNSAQLSQNFITFFTDFSGENADLDATISIAGTDGRQRLASTQAKGMVTLTNSDPSLSFTGKVTISLKRWDTESAEWFVMESDSPNMEISANQTQKVVFAFDGLEDKNTYAIEVSYYKDDEETITATQVFYTNFDGSDDMPGDVNGDGTIDMKDVAALIEAIANPSATIDILPFDINQDGRIDIADIIEIIKVIN